MSTQKALEDVKEIVNGLEDREGVYSATELLAAAILKAAYILAEAHSPEKKAAAALAIQEAKRQRHAAEISEIFAGWSDQGPAQDEKKHQTSPSGQSKSPGADETVILAPYDRGLGASRQQARGKGFLRRFLGY